MSKKSEQALNLTTNEVGLNAGIGRNYLETILILREGTVRSVP